LNAAIAALVPAVDHKFSTRSFDAAERKRVGSLAEKTRLNISFECPVRVLSLSRLSRSQIVTVLLAVARILELESTARAVTGFLEVSHLL